MARIAVIAPGRGTYNRTELNYLQRFADHPGFGKRTELAQRADRLRTALSRVSVTELDEASAYSPSKHLPGENASALIFTCAAADFAMLSPKHEIVAVLGNSMGWYTTLFTGGALDFEDAFRTVDAMGAFQKDNIVGGQIIYPIVDEQWRIDPEREQEAFRIIAETNQLGAEHRTGLSIRLGGFLVLAGTELGIKVLLKSLTKTQLGATEYPFQLPRHAAFHTPLMRDASAHGLQQLVDLSWRQPEIPMIDGRGFIWRKWQSAPADLNRYTLSHQVLEPYDFSASVRVVLREYNPDHLVLLGPGETLGGAIAHVMIAEGWRGIDSKQAFIAAQKGDAPPLLSMNRPEQAALVI